MILKVFSVSVLIIVVYTLKTTSQPITKHAEKRHVGWDSDESSWIWPAAVAVHHRRHLNSHDFHNHHVHDANCGHTFLDQFPTQRHRHYSGHSIEYFRHHPQVYPPLAPIYDPRASTSEKTTTTAATTAITATTTKSTIFPAPVFEEIDEETDDDKGMPPSSQSTVQNIPNTGIDSAVDTSTAPNTSGIDLRFGA